MKPDLHERAMNIYTSSIVNSIMIEMKWMPRSENAQAVELFILMTGLWPTAFFFCLITDWENVFLIDLQTIKIKTWSV